MGCFSWAKGVIDQGTSKKDMAEIFRVSNCDAGCHVNLFYSTVELDFKVGGYWDVPRRGGSLHSMYRIYPLFACEEDVETGVGFYTPYAGIIVFGSIHNDAAPYAQIA